MTDRLTNWSNDDGQTGSQGRFTSINIYIHTNLSNFSYRWEDWNEANKQLQRILFSHRLFYWPKLLIRTNYTKQSVYGNQAITNLTHSAREIHLCACVCVCVCTWVCSSSLDLLFSIINEIWTERRGSSPALWSINMLRSNYKKCSEERYAPSELTTLSHGHTDSL